MAKDNELLTVKAAAALAGVHTVTVYGWLKRGKVQGERDGRSVMIQASSLDDLLVAKGGEGAIEEPELDRARAIVEGKTSAPVGEADDDDETVDVFPESEADLRVLIAQKFIRKAVKARATRKREVETELLWMAVQELDMVQADELELGASPI